MKFTVPFNFGSRTIMIELEADSPADFIEQIAFYDSLPETTPKGATDLRFLVRRPKDKNGNQVTYYSIISREDNLEFKLHQHRANPKSLYSKGEWVRLVSGRDVGDEEAAEQNDLPPDVTFEDKREFRSQSRPEGQGKPTDADNEEKLTIRIMELLESQGIDSVGAEKMKTLKMLGLQRGLLVKQLSLDEKFRLYELLFNESKLKTKSQGS